MNFLTTILEHKQREVAERKRRRSVSAFRDLPVTPPRDFVAAVRRPGLSIIAEIKRRSPARGPLRPDADIARVAQDYARGQADALSVLTDEHYFGAEPADLPTARAAIDLPILRKDFVIDEYQIHESRAMGADAVLLIVALLDRTRLAEFLCLGRELRLVCLVEVHDEAELDVAAACGADMIGVNNRDLRTFKVDPSRCIRLRPRIPRSILAVAESGIACRVDVTRMAAAGFDAVLVGEALMTAPDPFRKLRELRGADTTQASTLEAQP